MTEQPKSVLFIDDDADIRKTADMLLRKAEYAFFGAANPEEALSRLVSDQVDVILLDMNFSRTATTGEEGLACLRDILRQDPAAVVIVVTGHSSLNVAVRALREGARDFIMKPWNNKRLVEAIEEALKGRKPIFDQPVDPSAFIGEATAMTAIKSIIDRCAPLSVPVLVRGEIGTGKTLAATLLHRQSHRAHLTHLEGSAVTPDSLRDQPDTTVIIENIERVPEAAIPALLAWLGRAQRQNSRLVATMAPRDPAGDLDRGVYYAVSTLDILLPPLKARAGDIVTLANHFLRVTCQVQGLVAKTLSREAEAALVAYPWPDNIHALKHAIERAVLMYDGPEIDAVALALKPVEAGEEPASNIAALKDTEKVLIEEVLKRHNFNVSAAAAELGLTRPALYRRMAKYGL